MPCCDAYWSKECAYCVFVLILLCFTSQPVYVGATWQHPETVHLLVGGFHQLLCAAVQANGLHDWWETYTSTNKASLSFWRARHPELDLGRMQILVHNPAHTNKRFHTSLVQLFSVSVEGSAIAYLHANQITLVPPFSCTRSSPCF